MNPVEKYLKQREGLVKKAGFKDMAGQAGTQLGVGAMQAVGVAGLMGLGGAVMKAYNAIHKQRDYKAMMEHNSDLRELQQEDPKRFSQFYSSFRSMNPTFAKDPIIAGTYLRQMSMSPSTAGKVIVESLEGVTRMKPTLELAFGGGAGGKDSGGGGFNFGRPTTKMKG